MDEWTSLSTDDGKKRGDPAEKVMIANCIPGVVVSARWLVSSAGYSPGCRATAEGCPLQNRKEKSSIQLRIDNDIKTGTKKFLHSILFLEKSNCQFNWTLKEKKNPFRSARRRQNEQQQHQSDIQGTLYYTRMEREKWILIRKRIDRYCQDLCPTTCWNIFHPCPVVFRFQEFSPFPSLVFCAQT